MPLAGCGRGEATAAPVPPPVPASKPETTAPVASVKATTAPSSVVATAAATFDGTVHPWLASPASDQPKPVDTLEARFAPPAGFTREPVQKGSFGAFLRTLPLAAPGTPVTSFSGKVLWATHPNIAAVVAIDVGKHDLQQCADSVIRMHAEWLYGKGRRDLQYVAANGFKMSFASYVAGERLAFDGKKLASKKIASPVEPTHQAFRSWLDEVFGWANTGSLSHTAKEISVSELRAGDFVVLPGVPFGHAVLILDVAKNDKGKRVLLLGQGYMPAQSFQVLRPSEKEVWFPLEIEMGKLETPFWDPFPFSALRRLDE